MTDTPTHTPYDGSAKPFSIGLKPLDLADWIEIDGHYGAHLAEKRRLYAELPDRVFVEERGTESAQREVLDLLAGHLRANADALCPSSAERDALRAALDGLSSLHMQSLPPLHAASLLVQEDLILMRKGDDGWRLAAGSLCFPSSWVLREKFGRPLQDIHAPVPDFGRGTRNADLIQRMFDNLQGQAVIRWNWSLQVDGDLYHPFSNVERDQRAAVRPSRFADDEAIARCFMRVERQTLRKLPASRDILFTIRIHLDPLSTLARHPDRHSVAVSFAEQLSALDERQLDYKGLTADRDRLVARLAALAVA